MTSSIDKHEMKKLKMVSVTSRTLEHLIKFKGTMLHSKTFLGRNGLRCNRERYMNTDIFFISDSTMHGVLNFALSG